jgi:hypothetical protein
MENANSPRMVSEQGNEVRLPNGCPHCGGPVDVKVSGSSARSVCLNCQLIAIATVQHQSGGVLLDFRGGGAQA